MSRLFILSIFLTSCGIFTDTKRQKESDEIYVIYIRGKYSHDILVFKDSTLYGQAFSDEGPVRSREFFLSNWSKKNDTTIVLYNILEKRRTFLPYVNEFYHTYKINENVELLIPDQSYSYFENSLKSIISKSVSTSPFIPEGDDKILLEILEKEDSVYFLEAYKDLQRNYYDGLLIEFNDTLDSLGIWSKVKL